MDTTTRSCQNKLLRTAQRAGVVVLGLALAPGCAPDFQLDCHGRKTDKTSDPENCGACGHDCLGGACVDSVCQPVVMASGPPRAFDVAVDAASLYWTSEGTMAAADGEVNRVPLDGGEPTSIAIGQAAPRGAVVDGSNVYWANSEGDTVMKAPKQGGDAVSLVGGQFAFDVAVDPTHLYWTNNKTGQLMMTSLDLSGGPIEIFPGPAGPDGIAVGATHVYWVNKLDGELLSVPRGGSANDVSVLFEGPASPTDIALDATHIYWTNYETGEVLKIPLEGGEGRTTVIATGQDAPFGLATDAAHVYWVNYGSGEIKRAPLEGGSAVTLAAGQDGPRRIALDEAAIYWTNYDSGEVMKLAK